MNNELKQEMTERFNSVYGEEVEIGLREALRKVYIDGGEHGYQYAVEKACEWLSKIDVNEYLKIVPAFGYVIEDEDAIKDFRKAMEE